MEDAKQMVSQLCKLTQSQHKKKCKMCVICMWISISIIRQKHDNKHLNFNILCEISRLRLISHKIWKLKSLFIFSTNCLIVITYRLPRPLGPVAREPTELVSFTAQLLDTLHKCNSDVHVTRWTTWKSIYRVGIKITGTS